MAATAPSEAAVIICLSGFVRRSPVANTPSILVLVVSSAMTYPSLSVFKWNLKSRVLGVFPIADEYTVAVYDALSPGSLVGERKPCHYTVF